MDKLPLSFVITPVVLGLTDIFILDHRKGLTKNLTVGELLDGYHLKLLDTIETLTKPLIWFGIEMPQPIISLKNNKYEILSLFNSSRIGPFEMYTGMGGSVFGKFVNPKNRT